MDSIASVTRAADGGERSGPVVARLAPADAAIPAWAVALVSRLAREEAVFAADGMSVAAAVGEEYSYVRAEIAEAAGLDAAQLQTLVSTAYDRVFLQLGDSPHPVRFWAFVPGIHASMGEGLDRYMVFNAGRFDAYCRQFGGIERFSRSIPTATAVGIPGDRLVLHCLASTTPGVPVENPRQIPAYRYSRRFGARPPCFARATWVSSESLSLLLVGGTSSVLGEESMHLGNAREQALETIRNLEHLVETASTCGEGRDPSLSLNSFREVRTYYRRSEDLEVLEPLLHEAFPRLALLELFPAELCRAELLVEIEGVIEGTGRIAD